MSRIGLALLLAGCLLVRRAHSHPCTDDAWSCLQTVRLNALRNLFETVQATSGGTKAAVESYMSTQQQRATEELLLWNKVSHNTYVHEPQHLQQGSGSDVTQLRQLLQLSGTIQDTKLSGNQLSSTSVTNTRITDPQGTLQAVGSDFSTFTTTLDAGLINRIMGFSDGLDAVSNALLVDLPDPDMSGAGAGELTAAIDAPPRVSAMDGPSGPQQQQQQQQRLQPTLRIIGGVEAPTDR